MSASLRWILAAALAGFGAIRTQFVWDLLPARMATHFGPTGAADGWMGREAFFAFLLVTDIVLVGVLAVAALLPASLINIPNREYWLAPSRAADTRQALQRWCAGVALITQVFLLYMLELTIRVNVAGTEQLPAGPFWLGLGCFLAATAVAVVALVRRFRLPQFG